MCFHFRKKQRGIIRYWEVNYILLQCKWSMYSPTRNTCINSVPLENATPMRHDSSKGVQKLHGPWSEGHFQGFSLPNFRHTAQNLSWRKGKHYNLRKRLHWLEWMHYFVGHSFMMLVLEDSIKSTSACVNHPHKNYRWDRDVFIFPYEDDWNLWYGLAANTSHNLIDCTQ